VPIVVHITNTPKSNAREAYETSWTRFDEHGILHPTGRQSHTAWLVGDVLHVVDVWDSEENLNSFMQVAVKLIAEADMKLAGPPEVGELLNVVRPE